MTLPRQYGKTTFLACLVSYWALNIPPGPSSNILVACLNSSQLTLMRHTLVAMLGDNIVTESSNSIQLRNGVRILLYTNSNSLLTRILGYGWSLVVCDEGQFDPQVRAAMAPNRLCMGLPYKVAPMIEMYTK